MFMMMLVAPLLADCQTAKVHEPTTVEAAPSPVVLAPAQPGPADPLAYSLECPRDEFKRLVDRHIACILDRADELMPATEPAEIIARSAMALCEAQYSDAERCLARTLGPASARTVAQDVRVSTLDTLLAYIVRTRAAGASEARPPTGAPDGVAMGGEEFDAEMEPLRQRYFGCITDNVLEFKDEYAVNEDLVLAAMAQCHPHTAAILDLAKRYVGEDRADDALAGFMNNVKTSYLDQLNDSRPDGAMPPPA